MAETPRYINFDELARTLSVEQVLAFYSVQAELHRVGQHLRSACFLNCPKTEPTGPRALAIEAEGEHRWRCHQYSCGRGGSLAGLIDLVKPGPHHAGKPRGQRFREIAQDVLAMSRGEHIPPIPASSPATAKPTAETAPDRDLPLAESPDERVRSLVELPQEFEHDVGKMPPHAASYVRRRPFLSDPALIERFEFGYVPSSSKSSLRGRLVYAYHDEQGRHLAFFARDTQFETKHAAWKAGDRREAEPVKVRFPAKFHRSHHLYGELQLRFLESCQQGNDKRPLVIVEGANDVLRLHAAGVPVVALTSNRISKEQCVRIATLHRELGFSGVTLLLDGDEEGEAGAKEALWQLAQHVPVRLGWTREQRAYRDRQPEDLNDEEIAALL